jgi:hypothetical protein
VGAVSAAGCSGSREAHELRDPIADRSFQLRDSSLRDLREYWNLDIDTLRIIDKDSSDGSFVIRFDAPVKDDDPYRLIAETRECTVRVKYDDDGKQIFSHPNDRSLVGKGEPSAQPIGLSLCEYQVKASQTHQR